MESRTTRDLPPDPDTIDEVVSGAATGLVLLLITGGLFVLGLFLWAHQKGWLDPLVHRRRSPLDFACS